MLPKISIITCVYNGAKYLPRLLDSVLASNYPSIEHIVVDDGSTDETSTILEKYKHSYNSAFGDGSLVIVHQSNHGLGYATNVALKLISGSFWTWINCDDWYFPDFFYQTIRYLLFHPKYDFVQVPSVELKEDFGGEIKAVRAFRINTKSYKGWRLKRRLYRNKLTFFHYLINASSFKSINAFMEICSSRKTQDVQLAAQIYGNLNGAMLRRPLIYYLNREDNLLKQIPNAGMGESELVEESIKLLTISECAKREQINLFRAGDKMNSLVSLLRRGNSKQLKKTYDDFRSFELLIPKKQRKFVHPKLWFLLRAFVLFRTLLQK